MWTTAAMAALAAFPEFVKVLSKVADGFASLGTAIKEMKQMELDHKFNKIQEEVNTTTRQIQNAISDTERLKLAMSLSRAISK